MPGPASCLGWGIRAATVARRSIYTRILPCRVPHPSAQEIRTSQEVEQRRRMRTILVRSATHLTVPGGSPRPAQVAGAGSRSHNLLQADGDYARQLAPQDGLGPLGSPEIAEPSCGIRPRASQGPAKPRSVGSHPTVASSSKPSVISFQPSSLADFRLALKGV
jgi:hypothetical protein